MKSILLLLLFFSFPIYSQTNLLKNTSESQIEFYKFNLDKLIDEDGNTIYSNNISMDNIIIPNEEVGENFGISVSNAGDVNNDGFDDIIIGACNYNSNQGRAYIYLGGPILDIQADVTMTGDSIGDNFGCSVSTAGDVNGDGISDVIIGAKEAGNVGKSYIYFGNIIFDTMVDKIFTIEYLGVYDFGFGVSSSGDLNGDGFDDVEILGVASMIGPVGFIFNGGSSMDSLSDVLLGNCSFVGSSAASAGDVNGDGYDDIIHKDRWNNAFIFFGGLTMDFFFDIELSFQILTEQSVSKAGDINGDGYFDVIVGSTNNINTKGNAYIYLGGKNMDSIPDIILSGENDGDNFGYSVSSAGDLNGDGFDDVIIGAKGFDSSKGKTYVYYGGSNMDSIPDATMKGETINDNFGYSVSCAGDMNGDGYSDIIVGANNYNQGSGRSYLYTNFIAPKLVFPANHSESNFTQVNFRWKKFNSADYYLLSISKDSAFTNIDILDTVYLDTTRIISGLQRNTKYYWKVEAKTSLGFSINSSISDFKTIYPISLNVKVLMEGIYYPLFNLMGRKDTAKVYLRNASAPYTVIDSANGVIDSVTFSNIFNFNNSYPGTYYIVVKHFNTIETWSRLGGELLINDGYVYNYDFTSSNSKAFGNNLKLRGSKYCLFSGDVNQDGTVDLADGSLLDNDAANFLSGYYISTDLNGDGIVDVADAVFADNNGFNFVSKVTP